MLRKSAKVIVLLAYLILPISSLPVPVLAQGKAIAPDQSLDGAIADGQTVEYNFEGYADTPVLFNYQLTPDTLAVRLEIFDSKGFSLKVINELLKGESVPFTPKANGTYKVSLTCFREKGNFKLAMGYVSGPHEQRNKIVSLGLDVVQKGNLADGAFDEYTFTGIANSSVLLSYQQDARDLAVKMEIFDSKGMSLKIKE